MKNKKQTDFRAELRDRGLRATPARLAVCVALRQASAPLTHAEVARRLDDRGTDQTTVFRNLNDLVEVGLVRRLEVGDHVYRFEWCGSNDAGQAHAHFVCVECGEVTCLPDMRPSAASSIQRAGKRLIGDITEVLLKGHCAHCA